MCALGIINKSSCSYVCFLVCICFIVYLFFFFFTEPFFPLLDAVFHTFFKNKKNRSLCFILHLAVHKQKELMCFLMLRGCLTYWYYICRRSGVLLRATTESSTTSDHDSAVGGSQIDKIKYPWSKLQFHHPISFFRFATMLHSIPLILKENLINYL